MAEPNFFDQFDEPTLQERKGKADVDQSHASAANSAASAETDNATRPFVVREAAAKATTAEQIAAKGPAPTDADTRQAGAQRRANVVRSHILGGIDMFRKSIEGQPAHRGFGYFEKFDQPMMFGAIPPVPAYEEFTNHNNAILPLIRPLVAENAKAGDSDLEMTIFQRYIPTADDSDRSIERKFADLATLIDGMTQGRSPSEIVKDGLRPASIDTVERNILRTLVPQNDDPTGRISPLQTREAAYETAKTGDQVVSNEDQEIAAQLQTAFDRGASFKEMRQMASSLYGSRAQLQPAELKKAIQFRDNFLRQGGRGPSGATVQPRERPMNTEERKNTESLESAGTAFGLNLGNGLALNTAPDIMGVFDPAAEQNARTAIQATREASPIASFAGEAIGSLPMQALLTRGVGAIPGVSMPMAAGLTNIGAGAITGAAESPGNRTAGAVVGGGVGALADLAGRYGIDPLVQTGLDKLTTRAARPTFTQSTLASRIGDTGQVASRLSEAERLGMPMGLADTSTEAQALAGRAARVSPEAADIAEATYPTRLQGRPERAVEGIERDVTAPVDLRVREEEIARAARRAAAPLYDQAYTRPPLVRGRATKGAASLFRNGKAVPMDPALESMLGTLTGRQALRDAYKIAEDRGLDPRTMGMVPSANGDVPVPGTLAWETLDLVRDAVASQLDEFRDPVTRRLNLTGNRKGQAVADFLDRFTTRLDNLNPDYKAARAAFEEEVKPRDFLRLGGDAADPTMPSADVERVLSDIGKMPAAQQPKMLQAFREGYATRLQDQIVNRQQGSDAYATVFGSPAQQRKMALIGVKPQDFASQVDLEQRMARTAAETRPQPMQQGRTEASETLDPSHLALAALETSISGAPLLTGSNIARNLAFNRGIWHNLRERYRGNILAGRSRKASELAPTLMGTDPNAALAALREAQSAVTARQSAEALPRALSIGAAGNLSRSLMATGSDPTYTADKDGMPVPLSVGASLPRAGESEEDRALRDLMERYGIN